MNASVAALIDQRYQNRQIKYWKRVALTICIALSLHLILIFFIFPYLKITQTDTNPIEVTQISPDDLAKMKKEIQKNKFLPPLLKQELHEEFKSKEAPKNAKFIAPFNQTVPEETIAGAQSEAPMAGGGKPKAVMKNQEKPISLSNLGLGNKIPEKKLEDSNEYSSPLQGPPGPFHPVGRDDKQIKKSGNNLLNAVENQYYSFFVRFEEPIIRNWYFLLRSYEQNIHAEFEQKKLGEGAELPVTLEFTIDRNGAFTRIDILQSSGIRSLDWTTREAVKKLGSLPNPPPGLFENNATFTYRLQFVVYLSNTPMSNNAPGLNWY